MSISNDWYPWKKTDCVYFYDYYRFTSQGLILEPCCNKHCFDCVDCECYEVEK